MEALENFGSVVTQRPEDGSTFCMQEFHKTMDRGSRKSSITRQVANARSEKNKKGLRLEINDGSVALPPAGRTSRPVPTSHIISIKAGPIPTHIDWHIGVSVLGVLTHRGFPVGKRPKLWNESDLTIRPMLRLEL